MIPLRPGGSALTFLYAKHLLDLSVILLDLPPDGADLSRIVDRRLFQIIGHDPFRATIFCRHPK